MVIPVFDSKFLGELAEAFRKRRKLLQNRGSAPEIYKVYQQQPSDQPERLEIVLEDGTQGIGPILRLNATADRHIIVGARGKALYGAPGWNWEYRGELQDSCTGKDVIAALEKTLTLLPRIGASNTDLLSAPWTQLLLRGPHKL